MSSAPQGPGWWQASDGKWYPPPPPPPSPYQSPPYGYAAPHTDGSAVAALVLSIVSFFICPVIAAVVAIFLAVGARRRIRASMGTLSGEGLATAAIVLSIIHLVLAALALAVLIPLSR